MTIKSDCSCYRAIKLSNLFSKLPCDAVINIVRVVEPQQKRNSNCLITWEKVPLEFFYLSQNLVQATVVHAFFHCRHVVDYHQSETKSSLSLGLSICLCTYQYVAHICRTGSLVTPPVAIILTRISSTSRSNMKFWLSVWHWRSSDMHDKEAFFNAGALSGDWIRLIKRGTISTPNFCVFFWG